MQQVKHVKVGDKPTQAIIQKAKGAGCSVSGNNYEKRIYNIIKKTMIDGKPFNTMKDTDLGGSTSANDIECNFNGNKNIGIEIKKAKTPDWMQCSIKYDTTKKIWQGTDKSKIPGPSRDIFNKLLSSIKLYDGDIPPFMSQPITHKDWVELKDKTKKWDDVYFDVPNSTIKKLYREKGCYYIQISDYGLYHLGEDICEFNVPEFTLEQMIRVRTKIHAKKNSKGFCSLSVVASCMPKNISELKKSDFSLDRMDKLPKKLVPIEPQNEEAKH
jgi:hypothetical protein